MEKLEYIVPCHFGLEAVLKREISDLGLEITCVEDGRVTFAGDRQALCRANIFLRSAQRVLIKIGSFHAETFEELFGYSALTGNGRPTNSEYIAQIADRIRLEMGSGCKVS